MDTQINSDKLKSHLVHALKKEFVRRCQKRSSYSMRAYAQSLDIDQSLLSKFLSGKRRPSVKIIQDLAPRLGISPVQLKKIETDIPALNSNFYSMEDDEFSLVSVWYHFAILELIKTKNFESNDTYISKQLGIHRHEAKDALERLTRIGLIKTRGSKIVLVNKNNSWTNTKFTNEVRRKLQKDLLERALDSIEQTPFNLRENASLTVAINSKRMPEFKEKLKQVRQELADFFQPKDESMQDEVYQLCIAFFPLTTDKEK